MMRKRLFVLTTMAAVLVACGDDDSPLSPTATLFSVSLTDPAGDAVLGEGAAQPLDPVLPDLRSGTIEITAAGTMKIRVRLEPGTFNRDTTLVGLSLDTDQNPATGRPFGGIGEDFFVGLGPSLEGQNAGIFRFTADGDQADFIEGPPVNFSTDGVDVELPLSLLGGDEGRMAVRIITTELLEVGVSSTPTLDYLPDFALPPGVVQ